MDYHKDENWKQEKLHPQDKGREQSTIVWFYRKIKMGRHESRVIAKWSLQNQQQQGEEAESRLLRVQAGPSSGEVGFRMIS